MSGALIKLTNVRFGYGTLTLLRDINLTLHVGESVVLLGRSGSGKSSLLKLIAGLLPHDQTHGHIERNTKQIGMLFQRNALFDSRTVLDNVLFPIEACTLLKGDAARERAIELLETVSLEHAAKLKPSEISGGMQKRLGIARAWAVNPDCVLYDEPTAGLDPITSHRIAALMRGLQKTKALTSLTVTNDLARARDLADRAFVLDNGCLLPVTNLNAHSAELARFMEADA